MADNAGYDKEASVDSCHGTVLGAIYQSTAKMKEMHQMAAKRPYMTTRAEQTYWSICLAWSPRRVPSAFRMGNRLLPY